MDSPDGWRLNDVAPQVEVLKDDTGQPWDTGSVLTVPGSKSGRPSSGTTHLALALGVQDRNFQLCVGASEQLAGKLRLANVPAGGSSIATFQSFAVAEQHLPLLQLLQRYQDKLTAKETTSPCDFEVDIVEVTWTVAVAGPKIKGRSRPTACFKQYVICM